MRQGAHRSRPRLEPNLEFQRRALMAMIGIMFLASIPSFLLSLNADWGLGSQVGLGLVILKNAVLLAWLKARRDHTVVVGLVAFAMLAVTGVWKFHDAVLIKQVRDGLGSYSYWLPLLYIVPFLVLRTRAAVAVSLGVFVALLSIGVAFWSNGQIPAAVKHGSAVLFVQLYLMHLTLLTYFAFHGLLLKKYVQTVQAAKSEALLANLDALTGLPNRRQLLTWLGEHVPSAADHAVSVILFDIDHFKRVNDTFGHDIGDDVLEGIAGTLHSTLRRDTSFGRWGGEEFLVVLPGADSAFAQTVAERLREALAKGPVTIAGPITASFGVAQAGPGETAQSLLKRADAALYAAKHAGRNRVCAA